MVIFVYVKGEKEGVCFVVQVLYYDGYYHLIREEETRGEVPCIHHPSRRAFGYPKDPLVQDAREEDDLILEVQVPIIDTHPFKDKEERDQEDCNLQVFLFTYRVRTKGGREETVTLPIPSQNASDQDGKDNFSPGRQEPDPGLVGPIYDGLDHCDGGLFTLPLVLCVEGRNGVIVYYHSDFSVRDFDVKDHFVRV